VFFYRFIGHGIVFALGRCSITSTHITVATVLSLVVVATAISVIDAMMLGGLLLGTNLFRLTESV